MTPTTGSIGSMFTLGLTVRELVTYHPVSREGVCDKVHRVQVLRAAVDRAAKEQRRIALRKWVN